MNIWRLIKYFSEGIDSLFRNYCEFSCCFDGTEAGIIVIHDGGYNFGSAIQYSGLGQDLDCFVADQGSVDGCNLPLGSYHGCSPANYPAGYRATGQDIAV